MRPLQQPPFRLRQAELALPLAAFRRENAERRFPTSSTSTAISRPIIVAPARGGRKSLGVFVETIFPIFQREKMQFPDSMPSRLPRRRYEEFRNNNTR